MFKLIRIIVTLAAAAAFTAWLIMRGPGRAIHDLHDAAHVVEVVAGWMARVTAGT